MSELVQINLRAGAEQKARWEAYVEEAGRYNSLSELIRASVEAEISDQGTEHPDLNPALGNDVREIHEDLDTVRKNVAWLRAQFQEDVDISDLAQAVFDELEPLPTVTRPIQVPDDVDMGADAYRQHLQIRSVVDPEHADNPSPQTAAAIAERLDTSPQRVEDAIAHLEEQFLPVTVIEYDGERHYFREE